MKGSRRIPTPKEPVVMGLSDLTGTQNPEMWYGELYTVHSSAKLFL